MAKSWWQCSVFVVVGLLSCALTTDKCLILSDLYVRQGSCGHAAGAGEETGIGRAAARTLDRSPCLPRTRTDPPPRTVRAARAAPADPADPRRPSRCCSPPR